MSDSPERPSSQDPPSEPPQPSAVPPAPPARPEPGGDPTPIGQTSQRVPAESAPPAAPPAPPPPPPPPLTEDHPEGGPNWGQILRWVLLIPVWLVVLSPLLGNSSEDEVVLYRFNKAIYCWPIILVGLLGSKLVAWNIATPVAMSWAFNLTIFLVFTAIMFDMPRNRFIVVLLVLGFTTITLWLIQSNSETLAPLTWIKNFFVGMDPQLDIGGARLLSWLLIPLLVFSIFQARVDGKVRITYNEIEFYKFGDVTDSITRFGKRVKLRVSDYLELLPGLGGGSLVIMNDDGNLLEEVNDLVGIVPRWPRINRILETWQTRELQDPAAKIAQT